MIDRIIHRRSGAFVLIALCITLIGMAWSFSAPLFSGLDERSHVIRAIGVANGDLFGSGITDAERVLLQSTFPETGPVRGFIVPKWLREPSPGCSKITPNLPATCSSDKGSGTGDGRAISTAGRAAPYYYVPIGAVSLVTSNETGIYLMRLVSCLIAAFFCAAGFVALGRAGSGPLAVLGLAVGLTPTCYYLFGTINPSTLEIAAAFAFWGAGAVYFGVRTTPLRSNAVLAVMAISAFCMVLSRPLAVLWLLVAVAAMLVFTGRIQSLRRIRFRIDPKSILIALTVAAGVVLSVGWTLLGSDLSTVAASQSTGGRSTLSHAAYALDRTGVLLLQTVGVYGYGDTVTPELVTGIFLAIVATLLAWALAYGRKREVVATVGLALAVVLLPAVIETRLRRSGFAWQGRYTLPIAIGVPLLAAAVVDRSMQLRQAAVRRLLALGFTLLALAQIVALYWQLRRNTVGLEPSFSDPFAVFSDPKWVPPAGSAAVMIFGALGSVLLSFVLYRVAVQRMRHTATDKALTA